MNLENQTPFPALMYSSADPDREEHKIVVMKVSYKMLRLGEDTWRLELISDGSVPLCFADEYWGEVGLSSVRYESDLAPYKPRCDVIINGSAYTPDQRPMQAIAVRLRLSTPEQKELPEKPNEPQALNPLMPLTQQQKQDWYKELAIYEQKVKESQKVSYKVQLEKTLSILGESVFKENTLLPGWKRTKFTEFTELPLRWEYAFGGTHLIYANSDDKTERVYYQQCFSNPLGTGWIEKDYFKTCEKINRQRPRNEKIENFRIIPAPKIEYHLQRQPQPSFTKHPKKNDLNAQKMAKISTKYAYQPAGFGFVGRAWAPRLALAGTYDEKWLAEQHPYPPQDTDYAYWNAAPVDQQIDFFYPNARLELWNLTKPEFSNKGYVCLDFLGHRPYITLHFKTGEMLPFPMLTETVLIDTDNMIISLTHKSWIRSDTAPLARVEARFSDEAEGALFEIND